MQNIPYLIELPSGIPVISGHFGASRGQPRGPQMKPRLLFHHDWDLLSIEEGAATFKLQDDRIFHVEAGHFLLLPPSVPIWLQPPRKLRFYFLHFSFYPIPKGVFPSVRQEYLEIGRKVMVPWIFSSKDAPGVLRAYHKLVNPTFDTHPWRTAIGICRVISELGAFALNLNLSHDRRQPDIAAGLDQRIVNLCRRISEDPAKRWKISDMAKSVGISRAHLNRLCRSSIQIELKHFIIKNRLDHAFHLLLDGSASTRSIKEISVACGFSSPAYFSRQFKKFFGKSPSAYRPERKELSGQNRSQDG